MPIRPPWLPPHLKVLPSPVQLVPSRPVPSVPQKPLQKTQREYTQMSCDAGLCSFRISSGESYVVEKFETPTDLIDGRLDGRYGTEELVDDLAMRTTFKGQIGDGYVATEIDAALSGRRRSLLTLKTDGKVIGIAIAMPSRRDWDMRLLLVQDEHQRRGLGQVLVDSLQMHVTNSGQEIRVRLPHCLSSQHSVSLWVRNGCSRPVAIRADVETVSGVEYLKGGVSMQMVSKDSRALQVEMEERGWRFLSAP